MDVGTASYTEYEYGPDVIKHMMENKHLLKMNKGHIHSHNSMSVFFSHTDMTELLDNSQHHNYYLSLIVNNENDMVAKIAFHAIQKSLTIEMKANNEEGKSSMSLVDETPVIYTYDCDITLPEIGSYDEMKKRIDSLKGKKGGSVYSPGFFQQTNDDEERTEKLSGSNVPKQLYEFITSWVSGNYGTQMSIKEVLKRIDNTEDFEKASFVNELKSSVERFYGLHYRGDRSMMHLSKVMKDASEVLGNYKHLYKILVTTITKTIEEIVENEFHKDEN